VPQGIKVVAVRGEPKDAAPRAGRRPGSPEEATIRVADTDRRARGEPRALARPYARQNDLGLALPDAVPM
jgi:hypothetical protein